MKKVYNIGDDIFLIIAFVSFIIGVVLRLLDVTSIIWGITPRQVIFAAMMCLLFSIALSLYDIAQQKK